MGPITLFDKSFLQSLSVDESLWFDHFFIVNVCPLFFVETLVDLDKSARQGRTAEQEVRIIAEKFPDRGTPNAFHTRLLTNELLGHPVEMTGKILVPDGRSVRTGGKTSVVFNESPEADAFRRWRKGEFLEVERRYAQSWRALLSTLDLEDAAKKFRRIGVDAGLCKSYKEAKSLADRLVTGGDDASEGATLVLAFLNVPQQYHQQILGRWVDAQRPPLVDYAPYAAHVLTVEIFLHIVLAAGLISERPSNYVDIA